MNGRELCGGFYRDAVAPLLADLRHSAGLLGVGSEVLGFDDEISTDHHFGPRALVFINPADRTRRAELLQRLADRLPKTYGGIPTNFTEPDPNDHGVQQPLLIDGPVNHRVEIHTPAGWSMTYLGFDATTTPSIVDWLVTPTQLLAATVDAAVFHDGLEQLRAMQDRLRWYPDDLWRHVLAAQWRRISQEEHFVGRTAQRGDDLGSRLLAGRLSRDLVRLAFLLERRHAPYVKWLGTAFATLPIAGDLAPALAAAVGASTYAEREAALALAYEIAMRATNALELAPPVDPTVRPFYNRGFLVSMGERFSDALCAAITDPAVLALPPHLGAVDQWADSTDVLSRDGPLRELRRALP